MNENSELVRRNKVNNWGGGWHYQNGCPNRCGYNLVYLQKYCEHCGVELNWPKEQE